MNCPNCRNDSVSFARVWLGMHRCPGCRAHWRLKWSHPGLSVPLRILGICLATASVLLGFRFQSWLVFFAVFAMSLAVNAFAVSRFARPEPTSLQTQRHT